MSDEVDLVTWLRDVADMKARVYRMEFEATRFRACADELAELRTKATEQGKYAVEMFDALKATQLELADLRKENERLTQNLDGAMAEVSLCHRLMERNEAEAETALTELRSIRDRLLEWYEAGHQGYSDIEDIIAAAKASKDGTL